MLNEHPRPAAPSLSMNQRLMTTRLTHESKAEVLKFLSERPMHTVVMAGLIRDNGMESKFNRGIFYACRDRRGNLAGVALIGHAMFVDARSEEALRQFARLAQEFPHTHMMLGERELIERFWKYYAPHGQLKRRFCSELLFELNRPSPLFESVPELRPARVAEQSLIVPVHAALAFEESGVNPLEVDPEGFRERCRRRIEERRVWVLVEDGKLIFKADVVSDTDAVIYLEGIYVHPERRGQGYGSRCLSELARQLLGRTKSISLLVDQERQQAQNFFRKLGFVSRGFYDTIFLRTQPNIT
jgi:hypothetical protein